MIIIKAPWEIERLRISNRVAAESLEEISSNILPGVSTQELDRLAEEILKRKRAQAAFKGYNGYPAVICASINEGVVHGIPGPRKLKEGDIVSIDIGTIVDGYYGDVAATFPVGRISPLAEKLMRATREALYKAIDQAREGHRLSDISHAIQQHVEAEGFSPVRQFVGHGLGSHLHEEPQIPNFGLPGQGPRLRAGMVLAIEPMVNEGAWEVEVLEDNWTVVTKDRKLSAHFEHTLVVTEGDAEILTELPGRLVSGRLLSEGGQNLKLSR